MAIAIYARKSVERENSISCETQIEYCKATIKPDERNEKVLTFVDNGFSGGNVDRDGFQKMMKAVRQGRISKVLVYKLDRISRSLTDFVGILNEFKEYNVEFISSQESFDTSSPYGEMIVKILMVFAEFERNAHRLAEKGEPLTAEVLNKEYMKLIRAYFGPKVAKDRQIALEWMRIPHFYSNFYVYKYATCISAASAIVKRIETEGEAYVGQYIEFLKCGGSKSPLESLLVAGIDMSDPKVVDGAIEDFASAIKQFREIYNSQAK